MIDETACQELCKLVFRDIKMFLIDTVGVKMASNIPPRKGLKMIFPKFECPCGNYAIEIVDGVPTPNGTIWSIKCSNCGRAWTHYVSDKQEGIDKLGNPKPLEFETKDNG